MPDTEPAVPEMPEPHPLVGTTVLYFHPLDWQYWPAVILDVGAARVTIEQAPEYIIVDGERKRIEVPPLPQDTEYYLQVLRPRGNDWVRTTHGDGPGEWRHLPVPVLNLDDFEDPRQPGD